MSERVMSKALVWSTIAVRIDREAKNTLRDIIIGDSDEQEAARIGF